MSDSHSNRKLRILVAEDHPVNLRILQLMLAKLGYGVDAVMSGSAALAAVRRKAYDLVLMDVQMPELDGLEATQQIRALGSSVHQPRIVAMSAGTTDAEVQSCLSAGMDEFLGKPVRPEELQEVLLRCRGEGQGSGGPAIDETVLDAFRRITQTDPAAFAHMYETYLMDARQVLREMEIALSARNFPEVKRKAHYLKGSSVTLGARTVAAACQQLEGLETADWPRIAETIAGLGEALTQVEIAAAAPASFQA